MARLVEHFVLLKREDKLSVDASFELTDDVRPPAGDLRDSL